MSKGRDRQTVADDAKVVRYVHTIVFAGHAVRWAGIVTMGFIGLAIVDRIMGTIEALANTAFVVHVIGGVILGVSIATNELQRRKVSQQRGELKRLRNREQKIDGRLIEYGLEIDEKLP